MNGYMGICGACFEPIKDGDGAKVWEKGKYYHKQCIERNPNSYYLALERIRGQHEKGTEPSKLLDQLEKIYEIPALNDEAYNEDNPEVIKLYKEIAASRGL